MQAIGGFPEVLTVFSGSSDSAQAMLHVNFIRGILRKMVPKEVLLDVDDLRSRGRVPNHLFPLSRAEVWGGSPYYFSLQIMCPFQVHAAKFFQEMVVRWLLPGVKLTLENFVSSRFSSPLLYQGDLLFADAVIALQSDKDLDRVRRNLLVLENEIFLGLASYYQAGKILEMKGISCSEKNAVIQDALSVLIQKKPNLFDYDLFGFMQQFLLLAKEEFKQSRECYHLSRIVYTVYLFKKSLLELTEMLPGQRHVSLKVCRIKVHLAVKTKRVLALVVGVNFIHKNELFDEHHLMKSIANHLPGVRLLEDSSFVMPSKDGKVQIVYLEIEKTNEQSFSGADIRLMRQKLPSDLKNHVERLMPALFMPRNEEEVMKNILVLSHELKYFKDLPQVIISFELQEDENLTFTVIVLRLLTDPSTVSVAEMYESADCRFSFVEDRVRRVGLLRGKYPKEATVFRIHLPKHFFVREDHTVDLLKARQAVVCELYQALGDFRDYNGGMIATQNETLQMVKDLLGPLDNKETFLFENFFHALMPMESRNVVDYQCIKNLFSSLCDSIRSQGVGEVLQEELTHICLIMKSREPFDKEEVASRIKCRGIGSCQLITALLYYEGFHYWSSLLIVEAGEIRQMWKRLVLQNTQCLVSL
ncbi:MAG: hypothetical protein NTZ52_01470 [Chlamydiae bacterium]|nr:hypothetical protein [Chlamydiota bacterium]